MTAIPASPFRQRLDRFARWFFNVTPGAQIDRQGERSGESRAAAARLAAARAQGRIKPRRRHPHPVPTTRAIRER